MPKVTHEELEDLRPALAGLAGGSRHAATYLYARYTEAMRAAGREPAHPVRFGQMLIEYGAMRRQVWDKGRKQMVRGWII